VGVPAAVTPEMAENLGAAYKLFRDGFVLASAAPLAHWQEVLQKYLTFYRS